MHRDHRVAHLDVHMKVAHHLVEHGAQLAFVVDVGHEHHELVAAVTSHHAVVAPLVAAQGVADGFQSRVAGRMAIRVVDRLEVVEVDEAEGVQGSAVPRVLERTRQLAGEHRARDGAGQPVGQARRGELEDVGDVGFSRSPIVVHFPLQLLDGLLKHAGVFHLTHEIAAKQQEHARDDRQTGGDQRSERGHDLGVRVPEARHAYGVPCGIGDRNGRVVSYIQSVYGPEGHRVERHQLPLHDIGGHTERDAAAKRVEEHVVVHETRRGRHRLAPASDEHRSHIGADGALGEDAHHIVEVQRDEQRSRHLAAVEEGHEHDVVERHAVGAGREAVGDQALTRGIAFLHEIAAGEARRTCHVPHVHLVIDVA